MRDQRRRKQEEWLFNAKEDRKVQLRRRLYNLMGLLAMLIFIIMATDIGGCARSLNKIMYGH